MPNTSNYSEQGGAREVIGGALDVVSGGEIDVESGGDLKVSGTSVITKLLELAAGAMKVLTGQSFDVESGGEVDIEAGGAFKSAGTDIADRLGELADDSMVMVIDKQLTNAEALALATSAGVEVIATPGANKAIVVHKSLFVADAAAGAWVEPSAPDDLVLQYAGGADITAAIEAGVMVAADVSVRTYGVLDTEVIPEPNVGINLFNTGSQWTGGNAANTISCRIWYSVVDTVAFS